VPKEWLCAGQKDCDPERVTGKHIAPHTIIIAALWAALTLLVPANQANRQPGAVEPSVGEADRHFPGPQGRLPP
jgi:hypothetical protein